MAGSALHPSPDTLLHKNTSDPARFPLLSQKCSCIKAAGNKKISLLCFLQWHLLLDALEGVGVFLDQIVAPFLILLFSRLQVSVLTFDDLQVVLVLCQFCSRHSWMLCSRGTREDPRRVDSTYTFGLQLVSEVCEPFASAELKQCYCGISMVLT